MGDIRLSDLSSAVSDLERLTEFYYYNSRGADAYDQYRSYKRTAQDASATLNKLSSLWAEFCSFQNSRAVAYDRYVTADREPEGCSCHISPPCSFCTRQTEEGE